MKTNYLVCLFFAAMMALAACTEEKIVYIEKSHGIELQSGEGIIELSVANALTTRAARPVVSSEATNNVNRVMFKFFDFYDPSYGTSIIGVYDAEGNVYYEYDEESEQIVSNNGVKVVNITDDNSSIVGSLLVFDEGKNALNDLSNLQKGLILKLDGLPGQTKGFKIVAYGYNQPEGTETDLEGVLNPSGTSYFTYGVDSNGDSWVVNNRIDEEIFAGYVTVEVNMHNKLVRNDYTLTLERQVAGILAYFYNVPAFVDNKKVAKITVSTRLKGFGIKFPASLIKDADPDSEEDADDYNGIYDNYAATIDLLTFTMKGNALNYDDVSEDGSEQTEPYYRFNNGYLLADEVADYDDRVTLNLDPMDDNIDNVLFGGLFLCPFEYSCNLNDFGGYATLNIIYWGTDGKEIKRIRLRLEGETGDYGSAAYQYDIRRNHFYSMGTIDYANEGAGNKPMDIDPGSGYDKMKIFLSDAWELIPLTNQSEN